VPTAIFDFVCEALERNTTLDKLEARGTVRLALRQAGLEAASVDATQMAVLLKRVMPGELRARGVEEPDRVCDGLIGELKHFRLGGGGEAAPAADSPETIFRRLAGG
jgi:hypothetical protein